MKRFKNNLIIHKKVKTIFLWRYYVTVPSLNSFFFFFQSYFFCIFYVLIFCVFLKNILFLTMTLPRDHVCPNFLLCCYFYQRILNCIMSYTWLKLIILLQRFSMLWRAIHYIKKKKVRKLNLSPNNPWTNELTTED